MNEVLLQFLKDSTVGSLGYGSLLLVIIGIRSIGNDKGHPWYCFFISMLLGWITYKLKRRWLALECNQSADINHQH